LEWSQKRFFVLHQRRNYNIIKVMKKLKREQVYTYTVFFEPIKGGYNVIFPAIPEICTFGKTLKEAREMAKDALRCFLESSAKENSEPPKDVAPLKERIAVLV